MNKGPAIAGPLFLMMEMKNILSRKIQSREPKPFQPGLLDRAKKSAVLSTG